MATSYKSHGGESITTQVVRKVADIKGTDPTNLKTPLYEVVDPDALEVLCSKSDQIEISFSYEGYDVIVDTPSDVYIRDQRDPTEN